MWIERFRNKWHHPLSTTLVFLCVFFTTNANATEYIVKFKKQSDFSKAISSINTLSGLYVKDTHQVGSLAKLSIDTKSKKSAAQKLATLLNNKDIEYVVENIKLHALERSSDTRFSEQWGLEKINAMGAWNLTRGSKNVVVAVIDTGVDVKHEDLAANIWVNKREVAGNKKDDDGNGFIDDINGWDFHQNDNNPNDETSSANPGHGTHCAGIIGAVGNNNIGTSGISQNVSVMPIRFLGADGSGDLFASTKAIDYAIANGAHVISASWGAPSTKSMAQPIIDAIERANQKGVLFVAAAGNEGSNNDKSSSYPANAGLANVIDVAASDPQDKKPEWSNFGRMTVDIASPGADILSTVPNNGYGKLSGTSMATPLVAGLAALLKSQDSSLTPKQIKAILLTTGAKTDIETACNCRIDAAASAAAVASKALTVVPAAGHLAIGETLALEAFGGTAPYTFKSSDPDVGTISSDGKLSAVKAGEVKITVEDASGLTATSHGILIGQTPSDTAGCPLGDPFICQILCVIMPDMPWCDGAGGGDDDGDGGENDGDQGGGIPGLPPGFPGLPGM